MGDYVSGFERAGWQLMWGNMVVFAVVCAFIFVVGGLDPMAAVAG